MNESTVTLPKKVFEDFIRATESFERVQDQLEDYLLSKDRVFISRMMRLRKSHQKGRYSDWAKLKSRYGV